MALWIGTVISCIIVEAVLLIFFDRPLYRSLGLLIGAVGAIAGAAHMEHSIIKSCSYDEEGAMKVMRSGALTRFGFALLFIAIAGYTGFADPICLFIGLLSLKIAAYAAPFTMKLIPEPSGEAGSDISNGSDEELDAFGYTKAERELLNDQLSRLSEKKRTEIEKMRKDFSAYYEEKH